MPALEHPVVRVVAVCDPNCKSDDYPQWARNELNDKIRKFLGDPNWAAGARGGLCGREVGLELVNRHYAAQGHGGKCPAYSDVREMLDKQKDLDAVYIMTPDHLHGPIAIRAMRRGKHVVTHKPIANVFDEVRIARETARQAGVASQLFCMADSAFDARALRVALQRRDRPGAGSPQLVDASLLAARHDGVTRREAGGAHGLRLGPVVGSRVVPALPPGLYSCRVSRLVRLRHRWRWATWGTTASARFSRC